MINAARSEELSDNDLGLMKQLVLGITSKAEELTDLAVGRDPGEGSDASRFLGNDLNLPTTGRSTHVRHAHLAMAFYSVTALDHMRAFVALLKAGRHVTPLATVTRGAAEALAKATYLLSSPSAGDLMHLYVNLANMELFVSTKHSDFAYFDGTEVDGKGYLASLTNLLAELGLGKVERIGLTTLASDLLKESAPGSAGRQYYSQLSSVPHGETAGVSMFIQESPVDRLGFAPRRDVLLPYAGVLFATCRLVIDKVIDHFGLECEYRESWNGVVDRAAPWLHELADSDQSL